MSALKNLKFKKIIYPVIFGVFFIGVILIFIYSAKFLVSSIDKSLSLDIQYASSRIIKIDFEKFYKVAKKMGIEISKSTIDEQQIDNNNLQETTVVATTTPEIIPIVSEVDKTAVKISVLNSTKIKGLADELKTILENNGFIVGAVGNYDPIQERTFIKIKESRKDYNPLIKKVIEEKYQLADDQALNETDIYDIIIIIGNK
ncbi:hypothetical protein A2999_00665 [Candidatus Wolfebacteria bacterium RIFCSPLOWO2_01_FULL_38_11]|uniref:LytR/CpsA/Psr regulator C-terminal domain-containing protein n=2 Tax=Candidatus Wolfeibacteriota TaxID=1752735 RepID=A0A0G0FVU6_9BACT|nr:MAG: hypothetical protein US36_C0010G0011 [Candidatus Wolfebacteria bacterium GW2011_GWC1_37_10]OGM90734.1 MAG: hypothetical protein A2999_00665 [Candidatus Wolfebacteria bacterium RIFCSPLOWO2_01_FULL_38_11]